LNIGFTGITEQIAKIGINSTLELIGVGLFFGKHILIEDAYIMIPQSPSSSRYSNVNLRLEMQGNYIEKIIIDQITEANNIQVLKDELSEVYNVFSLYLKA